MVAVEIDAVAEAIYFRPLCDINYPDLFINLYYNRFDFREPG
jgi:hypothetical protein